MLNFQNFVKALGLILSIIFFDSTIKSNAFIVSFEWSALNIFISFVPIVFQTIIYIFLVLSAFNPEKYSRIVLGIIIFLSFFTDLSFKTVTDQVIHISDMDMLLQKASSAEDAVEMYYSLLIKPFFISLLILFFYCLPPRQRRYKKSEVFAYFLPFVFIIIVSSKEMINFDEFSSVIPAFPRVITYIGMSKLYPFGYQVNKPVSLALKENGKVKNIVLVIDESISSNVVNENNETGISLYGKYKNLIFDFKNAHSSGNCTRAVKSYFRFALSADDIKEKRLSESPSLWNYAEKGGYETYLIGYSPLNEDYLSLAEISEIDNYIHMEQKDYRPYFDKDLAKKLKDILNKDNNKLIIIMKDGTHFYYDNSYPKDINIFSPSLRDGSFNEERLMNSYKNAVKWSLDSFFDTLLADTKLDDTFIIYTSDHGQSFKKYEKMSNLPLTHCRPNNPDEDEFKVPLLVITGKDELKSRLNKDYQGKPSHFNIVPTILDLMGYEKGQTESLFSSDLKCYPAFYNDPFGRFSELKVKDFCN